MSLERIFSELDSRKFQFVIDGRKYELPHLNTMKKELHSINEMYSKSGELSEVEIMFLLFAASREPFARIYKKCKLKDLKVIFKQWFVWSGFSLEKLYGLGKS